MFSLLSGYGWPRGLYCNSGSTAEHCHRLLEDDLGIQCCCEFSLLEDWKSMDGDIFFVFLIVNNCIMYLSAVFELKR